MAPDQTTLACASDRGGALQIYTLDRTGPLPVTAYEASCLTCAKALGFESATDPAWSPGLP